MSWQVSSKFLIIMLPSTRPLLSHLPLFLFVCFLEESLTGLIWETGCRGAFIPQWVGCSIVQEAEGIVHFSLFLENLMASSQSLKRGNKWCIVSSVWKTAFPPFSWCIYNILVLPQRPKWDWFHRSLTAWRHSLSRVLGVWVVKRRLPEDLP